MHDDEVHTDVGLVRRLLAGQFPEWADLPIQHVPSTGTDNALYRLGTELTVRLPRIHWAVGNVDREFEWLPRLAPRLPVAVPVPLARGRPGDGYPWPWTVCRWVEGENPVVGAIVDPGALAFDLAGFVAAMHRIDPAGGPPAGSGVPLATKDEDARTAIAAIGDLVDTAAVTAVWEAALQEPTWTDVPVWVHGDLSPGNVVCCDGRLRGVLDFGGTGIGDPACDLSVAWSLLPIEVRQLFRSTVGVDAATWGRARGWALFRALIQLPYYRTRSPALAAQAMHVIDQLLTEPGEHI